MKIKELYEFLKSALENAENCKDTANVEIYLNLENGDCIDLEIDSIGQFNICPDMTLELKAKYEEDIIQVDKLTDEQKDYKIKYNKVVAKNTKLKKEFNKIIKDYESEMK